VEWVTAQDGLQYVRVTAPTAGELAWADALAPAINADIDTYLGRDVSTDAAAIAAVAAAALRAFGYGWKYREAPFGEASWLDQGGAVRLAGDWIAPIKPILARYRDPAPMIG